MNANTQFDFSAQLNSCNVKLEELGRIAGVHTSTVCRWKAGHGGPGVPELRRWSNCPSLPLAFREGCANVVTIAPNADERQDLDADHDGKITPKDATLLRCRSHVIAGNRQLHFHQAIGDGFISPDELTEQQRMASEERHLSTMEMRVLAVTAGRRLTG